MELTSYLCCRVHITLKNDFYYEGVVLDACDKDITIKDKKGRRVTLTKESIATIREVGYD